MSHLAIFITLGILALLWTVSTIFCFIIMNMVKQIMDKLDMEPEPVIKLKPTPVEHKDLIKDWSSGAGEDTATE